MNTFINRLKLAIRVLRTGRTIPYSDELPMLLKRQAA
jgi:hypothetical protein